MDRFVFFAQKKPKTNVLRTTKPDLGLILTLKQLVDKMKFGDREYLFEDSLPSEVNDGFKIIIHDPFELPSVDSTKFYSLTDHTVDYLIDPVMTNIDESLLDYIPLE